MKPAIKPAPVQVLEHSYLERNNPNIANMPYYSIYNLGNLDCPIRANCPMNTLDIARTAYSESNHHIVIHGTKINLGKI